jgi:hypothetical protein
VIGTVNETDVKRLLSFVLVFIKLLFDSLTNSIYFFGINLIKYFLKEHKVYVNILCHISCLFFLRFLFILLLKYIYIYYLVAAANSDKQQQHASPRVTLRLTNTGNNQFKSSSARLDEKNKKIAEEQNTSMTNDT